MSSFYTKTQEPYNMLLERREWGAKRMRILRRDNFCCKQCGARESEQIHLQVHHKYYIIGLDPWEYKDSVLETLCEKCHSEYHLNNDVHVYRRDGDSLIRINLTPCCRCNGAGWFPEYRHVQGGICFRCHGAKYDEIIEEVLNYANEHDINLDEWKDGFNYYSHDVLDNIEEIIVEQNSNGKLDAWVRNRGETGRYGFPLDYSVKAKPGDKIDPYTLQYRKVTTVDGRRYTILKGSIIE